MLQTILHEEDIMSGACMKDLEKQRSFPPSAPGNLGFQENQQAPRKISRPRLIVSLLFFFLGFSSKTPVSDVSVSLSFQE